jgi:hypothetical protein
VRRFIALALLVVAARWLTRQKAAQPDFDALETELEQAVAEEIEWRLGSYLDAGQAELVTHAYPDVVSVWFEVLPKNPDAARISVSVSGDEVVAGIGHGVVDLFAEPRGSWQRQLGEILQAVADGRFQERISEGWMWQRKIEMSFPGTELGSARYSGLTYDDESGDQPSELGEKVYPPWRVA